MFGFRARSRSRHPLFMRSRGPAPPARSPNESFNVVVTATAPPAPSTTKSGSSRRARPARSERFDGVARVGWIVAAIRFNARIREEPLGTRGRRIAEIRFGRGTPSSRSPRGSERWTCPVSSASRVRRGARESPSREHRPDDGAGREDLRGSERNAPAAGSSRKQRQVAGVMRPPERFWPSSIVARRGLCRSRRAAVANRGERLGESRLLEEGPGGGGAPPGESRRRLGSAESRFRASSRATRRSSRVMTKPSRASGPPARRQLPGQPSGGRCARHSRRRNRARRREGALRRDGGSPPGPGLMKRSRRPSAERSRGSPRRACVPASCARSRNRRRRCCPPPARRGERERDRDRRVAALPPRRRRRSRLCRVLFRRGDRPAPPTAT